jgi:hypothetical protein
VLVPETFGGVVNHVFNRDVNQGTTILVALVIVAQAFVILLFKLLEIMVIAWV